MQLGNQHGDLSNRAKYAASEHGRSHQSTRGHLASGHQIKPGNDHDDLNDRLRRLHDVEAEVRQVADFKTGAHVLGDSAFPLRGGPAFGASGFDGFEADEGFDHHGVLLRSLLELRLREFCQRPLCHPSGPDDDRNGSQRDQHQRPANGPDRDQKQDNEWQVAKRGQGCRIEKFAECLEFTQRVGAHAR